MTISFYVIFTFVPDNTVFPFSFSRLSIVSNFFFTHFREFFVLLFSWIALTKYKINKMTTANWVGISEKWEQQRSGGFMFMRLCSKSFFFSSEQMNSVFVLFPFNPILHLRKLHTLKTQYRMNAISRANGSSRCFGTSKCFFMYIYSRLSCT